MEIVADVHIGIDVGVQITDGMVVIDMKKERREAMTNGEKLQSIFPNMEWEVKDNTVLTDVDNGSWFSLEWWNAEYKESTTPNDCETCIHNKGVLECDMYGCKYEPTTKNNLAQERYQDLIEHFGDETVAKAILGSRKEFKAWLERLRWNVKRADELARELEQLKGTTKNDLALIHTEGLDEEIRCTMCTNSMKSDRGCDGSCVVDNDMYKAVMDAIEKRIQPTTKNDLGDDYISREKAIDAFPDLLPNIGYNKKAITEILQKLPSVTPQEPRKGEWLRMSDLSEQEDDRYKCSRCGNVIHHKNKMDLYTFNSWCGRCGSDNGRKIEVKE